MQNPSQKYVESLSRLNSQLDSRYTVLVSILLRIKLNVHDGGCCENRIDNQVSGDQWACMYIPPSLIQGVHVLKVNPVLPRTLSYLGTRASPASHQQSTKTEQCISDIAPWKKTIRRNPPGNRHEHIPGIWIVGSEDRMHSRKLFQPIHVHHRSV